MTFIIRYSPVLTYLFLVGLCPLGINTTTGKAECTRFTRFYNAILFVAIVSTVTVLMCVRISITFSLPNGPGIPVLASTIQLLTIECTYIAVIVQSLRTATSHAIFLNGIVTLDKQIALILGTGESVRSLQRSSFFHWNMCETFVLAAAFSTSLIYANTLVQDPSATRSFNFFMLCLVDLMMVSMFSIVQHVRFCARNLSRRHRLLNDHLVLIGTWHNQRSSSSASETMRSYVDVFDLLDNIWSLREQFKRIFQFELLMNTMFDLVVVILTCFLVWSMTVIWHGNVGAPLVFTLFGTLFVLPVCKCLMLVSAVSQFGEQVCYARVIY